MFPLISAHFRALPPFGREQGVRWGPYRGHGWVADGRAHDFVFAGKTGHIGVLGWFLPVREWRLGSEISCSRLFPLISERRLHSGGGRVFAGTSYGDGFQTRPYMPETRLVGVGRGPDFVLAGKIGHIGALGSHLCGSGGWVRKFHVPAHFRSFPSVASVQAGGRLFVGARHGNGFETCPHKAGTRLGGCRPGGGFVFLGHNRTYRGIGLIASRRRRRAALSVVAW